VIPAGGSGKLTAKIKTNPARNGRTMKTISVYTDSPGAAQLRLKLGYEAVTPIVVSPSPRIYVNGVEGTPESSKILLHRDDGKPLEAAVDSSGLTDGVTVSLKAVTEQDAAIGKIKPQPGDLWLITEVGDVPGGFRHSGRLVVTTNHPDVPRLELPMSLQMRPIMGVRPDKAQLWPADGGPGGAEVFVRLHHGQRALFGVTSVEVMEPKLVSAELISSDQQKIHSVRVFLPDDFSGVETATHTKVRIGTTVPERPVIEVQVTVLPEHVALRRTARRPAPKTQPAGTNSRP
jgi:hypothetical protein